MYTEKERREDFNYFIKHYQELYNKYGHKFIAIKNSKILGVFDTEIEAITDVSKEYPLGTFIVQECNGNESGYTNYISSWQLVSI
ncbi:MAG: hypothetical protein HFH33_13215 [Eubacterium sp.]|nr:hypothetical protein [Eubacterium sp.]